MYGVKNVFFVFISSWVCNEEIFKENVILMFLVNFFLELINLCKIIFFFLKFERIINYIEMYLFVFIYKIIIVVDLYF